MSDSENADENSATEERGERQDFDTPWKKIVKAYFKEFVHFFFPEIARQIDWAKGYEFLDKELLKIAKDASFGGKRADIMARVHLLTGEEEWVLCHIEIQGQDRKGFSKRMYVYNYRGFDFFDRKVASLAVLADDNPSWRPDHFSYEVLETKAGLWFPTSKLLDFKDRWNWLEGSSNPFAAVVMAHLKAVETGNDPEHRYRWKLYLIKRLYRMGCGRRDVVLLFEFIDWIMSMPEKLEDGLWKELQAMEKEKEMEYITSVQRIGRREGRQEGVTSLLGRLISKKFNIDSLTLAPVFAGLTAEQVEELGEVFHDGPNPGRNPGAGRRDEVGKIVTALFRNRRRVSLSRIFALGHTLIVPEAVCALDDTCQGPRLPRAYGTS